MGIGALRLISWWINQAAAARRRFGSSLAVSAELRQVRSHRTPGGPPRPRSTRRARPPRRRELHEAASSTPWSSRRGTSAWRSLVSRPLLGKRGGGSRRICGLFERRADRAENVCRLVTHLGNGGFRRRRHHGYGHPILHNALGEGPTGEMGAERGEALQQCSSSLPDSLGRSLRRRGLCRN